MWLTLAGPGTIDRTIHLYKRQWTFPVYFLELHYQKQYTAASECIQQTGLGGASGGVRWGFSKTCWMGRRAVSLHNWTGYFYILLMSRAAR